MMRPRRSVLVVCSVLLLGISGSSLDSSFAVASGQGTTALTCIHGGGGPLRGEHCLESGSASVGWEQRPIPEAERTHAAVTNEGTASATSAAEPGLLQTLVGGIPVVISATEIHGTGHLEDAKEGEEHYASGSGTVTFSGVTVVEPPHCKVVGLTGPGGEGMVTTNPLIATTNGQEHNVLFTPETGSVFTEFKIENSGGTCAATNLAVKIVGSVRAQPDQPGATTTFNESKITETKELRFGSASGPAAGLGGKLTIEAGKEPETEPTHPISGPTGIP